MKKFNWLLAGFCLLVLAGCDSGETQGSQADKPDDYQPRVAISQENYSASAFQTDSDEDYRWDAVHIHVSPTLNLMLTEAGYEYEVTAVRINDISLDYAGEAGEVKIIHPKHLSKDTGCKSYYFTGCEEQLEPDDVQSNGSSFEYVMTDPKDGFARFYDEATPSLGILDFSLVVHNVGTYDYDNIMDRDGTVMGNKVLQYAGLEPDELDMRLSYDVEIEFDDGVVADRHFEGSIIGQEILDSGFASFDAGTSEEMF